MLAFFLKLFLAQKHRSSLFFIVPYSSIFGISVSLLFSGTDFVKIRACLVDLRERTRKSVRSLEEEEAAVSVTLLKFMMPPVEIDVEYYDRTVS